MIFASENENKDNVKQRPSPAASPGDEPSLNLVSSQVRMKRGIGEAFSQLFLFKIIFVNDRNSQVARSWTKAVLLLS